MPYRTPPMFRGVPHNTTQRASIMRSDYETLVYPLIIRLERKSADASAVRKILTDLDNAVTHAEAEAYAALCEAEAAADADIAKFDAQFQVRKDRTAADISYDIYTRLGGDGTDLKIGGPLPVREAERTCYAERAVADIRLDNNTPEERRRMAAEYAADQRGAAKLRMEREAAAKPTVPPKWSSKA